MRKILLLTIGIVLLSASGVQAQQDDSLHRIKRNGKWGYADDKGNEVIPCKYNHAFPFYESDLALVESEGKFGYIDKRGKVEIPLQYAKAYPFSDDRAAVKKNGKYGFVTSYGYEVIKPRYSDVKWGFIDGYAWVKKGCKKSGKWGMIGKYGTTFVDFNYINLSYFDPNTGAADAVTKDGVIHYYLKGKKYTTKKERDEAANPAPPPIKKKAPTIEWPNIPSQTKEQLFALKAQIKSDSKIESCQLYLNGYEVPLGQAPSGSEVVLDKDDHNMTINETLTLAEGTNTIKIKAANQGGVTEEQRTIQYMKPVVVANKALIVWNEMPSTTKTSTSTVEAEIKSTSKDISYQVLLNGKDTESYSTKGSYVVREEKKDGEYSYSTPVNKTLALIEGNNDIQIIVKNAKGETMVAKQQSIVYAKPQLATIIWKNVPSTQVTEKLFVVRAEIHSESEVEYYRILKKGVEVRKVFPPKTKGLEVVHDRSNSIDETITLDEGDNEITIEVKNAAGTIISSKTVNYKHIEKRIALVIGNGNYDNPKKQLPCTTNDADAVANKFRQLGFKEVILRNNLKLNEMISVVNNFKERAKDFDVVVLYYSGHGRQTERVNYLIPTDYDFDKGDTKGCMALPHVLKDMKDSQMKIVIFDACRDQPIPKGDAADIDAMNNLNVYVAYASAVGQVSNIIGGSKYSVFTDAFLKTLDKPNLTLSNIMFEIRKLIPKENGKPIQIPYEENSLEKDFIFNKK